MWLRKIKNKKIKKSTPSLMSCIRLTFDRLSKRYYWQVVLILYRLGNFLPIGVQDVWCILKVLTWLHMDLYTNLRRHEDPEEQDRIEAIGIKIFSSLFHVHRLLSWFLTTIPTRGVHYTTKNYMNKPSDYHI